MSWKNPSLPRFLNVKGPLSGERPDLSGIGWNKEDK